MVWWRLTSRLHWKLSCLVFAMTTSTLQLHRTIPLNETEKFTQKPYHTVRPYHTKPRLTWDRQTASPRQGQCNQNYCTSQIYHWVTVCMLPPCCKCKGNHVNFKLPSWCFLHYHQSRASDVHHHGLLMREFLKHSSSSIYIYPCHPPPSAGKSCQGRCHCSAEGQVKKKKKRHFRQKKRNQHVGSIKRPNETIIRQLVIPMYFV